MLTYFGWATFYLNAVSSVLRLLDNLAECSIVLRYTVYRGKLAINVDFSTIELHSLFDCHAKLLLYNPNN